jgi:hypothetical protein
MAMGVRLPPPQRVPRGEAPQERPDEQQGRCEKHRWL